MFTAKQIGKTIKSRGLQKVRHYCQMCQRQCKDANGYKCHQKSEAHLRQMSLFRENPDQFVNDYSREFEKTFLSALARRGAGGAQVDANNIYNEIVSDRKHIHMNSTKWESLSSFIMHLGKTSQAIVNYDEAKNKFYLTYINRDPAKLAIAAAAKKRDVATIDAEERKNRQIEKQMKATKRMIREEATEVSTDQVKRLKLTLNNNIVNKSKPKKKIINAFQNDNDNDVNDNEKKIINNNENNKKEKADKKLKIIKQQQYNNIWPIKNIYVKIMDNELGNGMFLKQKGIIKRVESDGVCEVEVTKLGAIIKIHQSKLETVIPAIGRPIMILKGEYRGEEGIMKELKSDIFQVICQLKNNKNNDIEISVGFDDLSKLKTE